MWRDLIAYVGCAMERSEEGLVLDLLGPDGRRLEVTIYGGDTRYMATWFADDRSLRVQEGRLGLNAPDIEATVLWLLTGAGGDKDVTDAA